MDKVQKKIRVVIVSGLSGAGISTAIHALEDLNFYCLSHVPVHMFDSCLHYFENEQDVYKNIAFAIDARNSQESLAGFAKKIAFLQAKGKAIELVFLDAEPHVLLKRFHSTRRKHPLDEKGAIQSAIQLEKTLLEPIRKLANHTMNTSKWSVHDLRQYCMQFFSSLFSPAKMFISVVSFGFKTGIPQNADLVFDVRFLKNPYFEETLKHLSGLDGPVRDYVLQQKDAQDYILHLLGILDFAVPKYQSEPKTYLTVAIGCTGGQHRSVAIAENIYQHLNQKFKDCSIKHRDVSITSK